VSGTISPYFLSALKSRGEETMSRLSTGAACALLALVGLTLGHHLGAQQAADPFGIDQSETASKTKPAALDAEDRIEAALNAKLVAPLQFLEQPLVDIVNQLQEEYNIPIQFDHSALDEIAVSTDTEVSASIRNVTLRSALNLILKTPGLEDLTYLINDEVLLITTKDRANETLMTIVYRVDDLLDVASDEDSSKKNHYSSLQDVITSGIEFDSWQANGTGEGSLFLMKPGMLVVTQTRKVHLKVEELLDKLRHVKQEIERDAATSSGNF
jgi:hypothetical protein